MSGGVDHGIHSEAVSQRPNRAQRLFRTSIQRAICAKRFGKIEALAVLFQTDDAYPSGAGEFGERQAKQPNRSRTQNQDGVARTNGSLDASCVVSHAARFGQCSLFEADRIRKMMQATRRNLNEGRHRTVNSIPKAQARRANVVLAAAAVDAMPADAGRGLARDAIAFLKTFHSLSDLHDYAAKFMP